MSASSPAMYAVIACVEEARRDGSTEETAWPDQVRKASRSRDGTPSSSQITDMGSGKESASTRSAARAGAASIESSSPSVISWIRGASCSMRRGVNSRVTSLRIRVWSGASEPSIEEPADTLLTPSDGEARLQCLESRWSARRARPASYPTTSQASAPSGIRTRWTGPFARRAA
ncbi:hypothetical protein M2436_006213 [Streptomyces sp. HB372]|nr:hypothetical protein [Streptomyces sp. HB372]